MIFPSNEIDRLGDLDLAGLRKRWRSIFRKAPPPHLARHLLLRVLAYRLQVDEHGDLPRSKRYRRLMRYKELRFDPALSSCGNGTANRSV